MLVGIQLSVFGLYLPPVFSPFEILIFSAPDDHFTASPHCRLRLRQKARWYGPCGCPAIRVGIISPAGVDIVTVVTLTTPDNHFTASPYRRVSECSGRRVGSAGSSPYIRAGIVSPTHIGNARLAKPTPDDHFRAVPYCRVYKAGIRWPSGGGPGVVDASTPSDIFGSG